MARNIEIKSRLDNPTAVWVSPTPTVAAARGFISTRWKA